MKVLLSCEHASAAVPREFSAARIPDKIRTSHRGWDRSAMDVAQVLSNRHGWPILAGTFTRLLIDLNRSPHHPGVLSEFSRQLPLEQQLALRKHHAQFREEMHRRITSALASAKSVLHFSVHSFTPELDPPNRQFDLGLLYDPARKREQELCCHLQARLQARGWSVRRNAPYRGNADGHTTSLRKRFSQHRYLGIEIECNQLLVPGKKWQRLATDISAEAADLGLG